MTVMGIEASSDKFFPLALIVPDEDNIREVLAGAPIEELADSILAEGQLQPITVYPVLGGLFKVWMGHRRHAALMILAKRGHEVLAWVNVVDGPESELARLDKMTAENLQRQQLNPIEEARVFKRYIDQGLSQKKVAERLAVSAPRVNQYLQLLDFSYSMQRAIANGQTKPSSAIAQMAALRRDAGHHGAKSGIQRMNRNTPHFNPGHPMHSVAEERCKTMTGHEVRKKLGAACGLCWEYVIRADGKVDAAAPAARYNDPEEKVAEARPTKAAIETFTDPREILRRLKCLRCSTPALSRNDERCSAVRDGKRVTFPTHEFRMAVSPKPEPKPE